MARERTVIKGIVLRAVDTKESDKILTLLTPGGKLPVVAKGARSRKSRVCDAQAFETAKNMVDLREDQIERYQELLKEQKAMRN